MTLSLNAATAPARPAQLPDPATADAQQTESGGLFRDALSLLGQVAIADTGHAADGQASEQPVEDAAGADSPDTLPGMSQPILPMMFTIQAALSAPVQIAQAAPDTKPNSESAVPVDAPSMAVLTVTGSGLASGEMVEKVGVEAGKLDVLKGPAPAPNEMAEKVRIEAGKLDAVKNSAPASAPALASASALASVPIPASVPSEIVEKVRVEAGKLDAGKDPALAEMVDKARVEAGKLNAGKDPVSKEQGEKTYAETNKLLDAALHVIPNGPTLLRARDSNPVVQEASAAPRVERAGLAAVDQISQPVKMPVPVSAGEVQEVKQQTALASVTPGTATVVQAADTSAPASQTSTLKLAAEPAQSGQQLLHALKDRIQFQVEKHSENATIRLDPPMMGRIEITVRHEAGALQVQLSATNSEVVRQLQAIGDNLRQDLVQRHYSDVSVSVSDHGQDGRQQQHQQEQGERERKHAGRALAEAGQEDAAFALASDND